MIAAVLSYASGAVIVGDIANRDQAKGASEAYYGITLMCILGMLVANPMWCDYRVFVVLLGMIAGCSYRMSTYGLMHQ